MSHLLTMKQNICCFNKMFGKIHNNVRDAIATSIPTKTLKGSIKEAQQKGPKGLPGPFGVFNNMPVGAKAIEANALKKAMPKAQKPGTSTTTGVNLMKGKWVKKGMGRRWQPDGLSRPMTPFEEHQWAVQRNMDSHKGKPKKETQYIKNTWKPEGEYLY